MQTPQITRVDAVVDLLPNRRVATIENAWIAKNEVEPGEVVPVKVFLRPYRGARIEREFGLSIPATLSKGDHQVVLSDADTLNRMQSSAAYMNRYIDVPQIVSLRQPGTQQRQAVRVAGRAAADCVLRRQDASQPARVRVERDAGRPLGEPLVRHFGRERDRTGRDPVRLHDQRKFCAQA